MAWVGENYFGGRQLPDRKANTWLPDPWAYD